MATPSPWLRYGRDNCPLCAKARQDAMRLPRTRLGRREREFLVKATRSGTTPAALVASPPGTKASAERRALISLQRKGLIVIWPGPQRVQAYAVEDPLHRRWINVRSLQRTPLGDAVVDHFGHALLSNQRLRWTGDVEGAVLEEALSQCDHRVNRFVADALSARI